MTAFFSRLTSRPLGRVALALIILNEVRGAIVVAAIVSAWWKAH